MFACPHRKELGMSLISLKNVNADSEGTILAAIGFLPRNASFSDCYNDSLLRTFTSIRAVT